MCHGAIALQLLLAASWSPSLTHITSPVTSWLLWLPLAQRDRLDIGKISEREVGHWNSCPGGGEVPVPCHRDVALRDVVSGHGGGGMRLDLGTLEVFSNLNDSLILSCGHQSWLCW